MLEGMYGIRSRSVLWAAVLAAGMLTGCMASSGYNSEPQTPEEQLSESPPGYDSQPPVAYRDPSPGYAPSNSPFATAADQSAGPQADSDSAVDTTQVGYQDTDPTALTQFRDELSPYGAWVEDPAYGTVWVPSQAEVGSDFTPYVTAGHWAMTEEGDWLWVSDYRWGWATFHYGRWVWIPGRGWAWIAGRTYAPAWVEWRVGEPGYAYVGWAPMPPYYYWSGGVAVGLWWMAPAPYVYCESSYVFGPNVHSHVITGHSAAEPARRTRPYHPAAATPGAAGSSRHAATPVPRGPSLSEANIPRNLAPKTPARPEPKALALAGPQPRLTNKGAVASQAPNAALRSQAPAVQRPSLSTASRSFSTSDVSRPVYRGRPAQQWIGTDRPGPTVRPVPGSSTVVTRPTPTLRPTPSSPVVRGPSPSMPSPSYSRPGPTLRPSPSYPSAPAFRPSTPSYQPSTPSFRPSTPSFRPSTPSFRPSTPSFSPSTPAVRPSSRPSFSPPRGGGGGGGPRFGGGGRIGGHRR